MEHLKFYVDILLEPDDIVITQLSLENLTNNFSQGRATNFKLQNTFQELLRRESLPFNTVASAAHSLSALIDHKEKLRIGNAINNSQKINKSFVSSKNVVFLFLNQYRHDQRRRLMNVGKINKGLVLKLKKQLVYSSRQNFNQMLQNANELVIQNWCIIHTQVCKYETEIFVQKIHIYCTQMTKVIPSIAYCQLYIFPACVTIC